MVAHLVHIEYKNSLQFLLQMQVFVMQKENQAKPWLTFFQLKKLFQYSKNSSEKTFLGEKRKKETKKIDNNPVCLTNTLLKTACSC